MSSKPSPEGAKRTLELIQKIDELDEQLTNLQVYIDAGLAAQRVAQDLNSEFVEATRELEKLLLSMDVASPGNYGWESRLAWFLRRLIFEVRRNPDGKPVST